MKPLVGRLPTFSTLLYLVVGYAASVTKVGYGNHRSNHPSNHHSNHRSNLGNQCFDFCISNLSLTLVTMMVTSHGYHDQP